MIGGRQENQDDWGFVDTPLGFFLIVCDGMGGGPAGKTASNVVKTEMARSLCENNEPIACDIALRKAAARAHDELSRLMNIDSKLQGMGSTFVSILLNKQAAYVAHAGDSRCYQLRGGKCIYRSQDHSLVAELVRKKALTEEEARLSPQSNVISRGLGGVSNHVPDIEELAFKTGDRFVLCTDGIWGAYPHKSLLSKLNDHGQLSAIVANISMEVDNIGIAKGGMHDNHTLAMLEVKTESVLKQHTQNSKLLWGIVVGLLTLTSVLLVTYLMKACKEKNVHVILEWSKNTATKENEKENIAILTKDANNEQAKELNNFATNENHGEVADQTDISKSENEVKQEIKTEPQPIVQETGPFDSVYFYLDLMKQVKEKDSHTAVSLLDGNIRKITRYLERLADNNESLQKDIRKKLLNVIGDNKKDNLYPNMNKVMKVIEEETYYIPTENANKEMDAFRRRVESIAQQIF